VERLFLYAPSSSDGQASEELMNTFRKASPAKSVMFVVDYDDARRAYLWVEDLTKANDSRAIALIARTQQEQGTLPEGTITGIRRVR
jgi:hypothetical protein